MDEQIMNALKEANAFGLAGYKVTDAFYTSYFQNGEIIEKIALVTKKINDNQEDH